MIVNLKKYSIMEFKSYGIAGQIAQEALSSLRTFLSFGIHNKVAKSYE